jgi:hypothetical protein
LTAIGCTDASLYSPREVPSQPDRLALSGRVCTDNPADRSFPLKVFFLVDASPVLGCTDPAGLRVAALQDAVQRVLSPARPNRQVAVARYAGAPELLTDGFTADAAAVTEAVAGTLAGACTTGCRDTESAVSLAAATITGDLLRTPSGTRSRTRYLLVLMGGGPPLTVPCSCRQDCGCDCAGGSCGASDCLRDCVGDRLIERFGELDDFARENGAADFAVHAVHLRMPDACDAAAGVLRPWADEVLSAAAERGGGQFVGFDAAEGFGYQGLALEAEESPFQMSSLMAANVNVRVSRDGPLDDSDGDGLSDPEEETLGTAAEARDTDGDGLGDRVEVLLGPTGIDPTIADQPAACLDVPLRADDDGDGLRNCEELLLGTDTTLPDTDADGVPDSIEFLWGTNFLAADRMDDLDQDGVDNGLELQLHSDPRANDPQARADLGYQYSVVSTGIAPHPYFGELRQVTGVTLVGATPASRGGVGEVVWDAGARTLAWRDPGDFSPGPPAGVDGDDRLVLQADSSVEGTSAERSVTADVRAADLPGDGQRETVSIGFVEQECVDFRVSNVLLRGTRATDETVAGTNRVYVFLGEVPRDHPLGVPLVRAALVQVVFVPPDRREPAGDEIVLVDGDFVLLGGEP